MELCFLPWCMYLGKRNNIDSSRFVGTSASYLSLMRRNIIDLYVVELQEQVKSYETKLQRLKEAFKTTSQEYREVCYMLLGYKIDRIKSSLYRLSSMYAESQDDYLLFKVCIRTKISLS